MKDFITSSERMNSFSTDQINKEETQTLNQSQSFISDPDNNQKSVQELMKQSPGYQFQYNQEMNDFLLGILIKSY